MLFARLFDVHTLDQSRLRSLLCVLGQLSGGHGEWSAPGTSGKSFVSNASSVSRCHFAQGSQLAQYPYMVQSLERQLATLRTCYERMLQYEGAMGTRFDWILRTRTDTAFLLPAMPPRCHARLDASTVMHARSFSKGSEVHHMFGDHAAAVPRLHARAFFVGIGERLAACVASSGRLPPSFSEPESFIHHALVEGGVPSAAAPWLAPLVVSVDGRMLKWCGRYLKLRVAEVVALGATQGACADAMLHPAGKWAEVAAPRVGRAAVELQRAVCSSGGGRGSGGRGGGPAQSNKMAAKPISEPARAAASARSGHGGEACTWSNGCCTRHPRLATCLAGEKKKTGAH